MSNLPGVIKGLGERGRPGRFWSGDPEGRRWKFCAIHQRLDRRQQPRLYRGVSR